MRTVVAALLAVALGCGGGGDHSGGSAVAGSSASSSGGSATQSYDNGHPLVLTSTDPTTLANESEVLRLVNDRRNSIGKNALTDSSTISNVTRAHSQHMIVHAFFDHTNPEGDSPGTRGTKGGVSWTMYCENIAAGFSTAQSAYDAWMNSPGHKANIERDGLVYSGVGYSYDSSSTYRWYWTQNFTRP